MGQNVQLPWEQTDSDFTVEPNSVLRLMRIAHARYPIRHNTLSDGDVKVCLSYDIARRWIGSFNQTKLTNYSVESVLDLLNLQTEKGRKCFDLVGAQRLMLALTLKVLLHSKRLDQVQLRKQLFKGILCDDTSLQLQQSN